MTDGAEESDDQDPDDSQDTASGEQSEAGVDDIEDGSKEPPSGQQVRDLGKVLQEAFAMVNLPEVQRMQKTITETIAPTVQTALAEHSARVHPHALKGLTDAMAPIAQLPEMKGVSRSFTHTVAPSVARALAARIPQFDPNIVARLNEEFAARMQIPGFDRGAVVLANERIAQGLQTMATRIDYSPAVRAAAAGFRAGLAQELSAPLRGLVQDTVIRPLNIPTADTTEIFARAAALEASFTRGGGGGIGYAGLREQIQRSPRLAEELAGLAQVASQPGPLGVPVRDLSQRVERVQDVLDENPELVDGLTEPLAQAEELSWTDQWDVIDLSAGLGIYHAIRDTRVNGVALAFAVTAGIGRFLIGLDNGDAPAMGLWDAAVVGGAVYVWVDNSRLGRALTRRPEANSPTDGNVEGKTR